MVSQKRLFMSYGDFERLATEECRRPKRVNTDLAHIVLPSGMRQYPIAYIELLITTAQGQINSTLVKAFNASPRGTRAIQIAKVDFYNRIHELADSQPHPGYLTVREVTMVVSVIDSAVRNWCYRGKLPWRTIDEQLHVLATDLEHRCLWHSA